MAKLALTGGAYQARSIIANAQRCVNLYPERNQEDAPFPFTHYPTPGLTLWLSLTQTPIRGMYLATNGDFYVAAGPAIYLITSAKVITFLGAIAPNTTPVSMCDNGQVVCIVDGSASGYVVDLTTHAFTQINNPAFYGAISVNYVDTYFVFNRPGTNQFYITVSNLTTSNVNSGPIQSGTITAGGANYSSGTFTNVPLTGGHGTGAQATVVVTAGVVTSVTITSAGQNYMNSDVLTASLSSAGAITTIGSFNGTGIINGTYANKAMSGGSGSGATATFVVAGTKVTSVTIVNPGINYSIGDSLYVNLPAPGESGMPGTEPAGFTVTGVNTVGSGFQYTVTISTTSFQGLDIAAKTGFPDIIQNIAVVHRELWLIGQRTTEVWYNTGASDFTFGIMPGVFIQHGCIAPYSLSRYDLQLFWLSQNEQGQAIVVMIESYSAKRISTHAIEAAIQGYSTVSDAVGFVYQQGGHVFYVLNFPTGNATWVYDATTQLWHQRSTIDSNGNLNRHLPSVFCNAFGLQMCGDYANGNIYYYDQGNYTDNGITAPRIRSWPHIQNDDKRVSYSRFIADMEVGNAANIVPGAIDVFQTNSATGYANNQTFSGVQLIGGSGSNAAVTVTTDSSGNVSSVTLSASGSGYRSGDILTIPSILTTGTALQITVINVDLPPLISLRWSDDRGQSYSNAVEQDLGGGGQYLRSVLWTRLGMARDRVFELSWSANVKTALNGAYAEATPCRS